MQTYINTFEMFGDPVPAQCDSAEEYAQAILPLFKHRSSDTTYWVSAPVVRVGMANEIEWTKKAWATAIEEAEDRGETVDDDAEELEISEDALLDLLLDAVQEVKAEEAV